MPIYIEKQTSERDDYLEVNTTFMHNMINHVVEKLVQKYVKNKLGLPNVKVSLDQIKASHKEMGSTTTVSANVQIEISNQDLRSLIWKI